jgi:Mg-chelatase subunit ChlD
VNRSASHATIRAATTGSVRLELRAGEQLVGSAVLSLSPGEHDYVVDAAVGGRGPTTLEARVSVAGATDPRTAGRAQRDPRRRAAARAAPRRRPEPRDRARRGRLRPFGIATEFADPQQPRDVAAFAGYAAVLVDDVPAGAWLAANQAALRDTLREHGTGLVMAGTHHNLGPGGYAPSPLAEVLPVRMPQREERRDPSVSLVLIVDTSGSMGGGRLELAKEVARLAIQKLQPHDKCGLIEFHGSKRWAAPLQPATNTIEITRALNRLQVGGGTIIYEALEESHYALLAAQTRFQHVLVLTDGGVESGPFEALARRMATSGQTVSTVLIGPQANSPFLQNLAQWGRGRFYACPDKFQMPDLQFREPQSALLPAVQERTVPLERTGDAEATAAFADDHLRPSGGIVEASVRQNAEVLLRGTAGEPWLIGWDHGAGRALVLAGQTLGPRSGELREDPAWSAFLADLLRNAASGALAQLPRLDLRTQERGVRIRLELPPTAQLPATPSVAFAGGPPTALVATGSRWEGFLPFSGPAPTQLDVRTGSVVLASGAATPPLDRRARTRAVDADLAEFGNLTPRTTIQRRDLTPAFTIAALALFLIGQLLRRLPLDGRER